MKKPLKTALTLFLICAFFTLLLALVNRLTAPHIEQNRIKALYSGLNEIVSDGEIDTSIGEVSVNKGNVVSYYPVNKNGTISGYVLSLNASGYGGDFSLIAYYDLRGTVKGVKMLENSETPGIGKKYEDASLIGLFTNYNRIPLSKSDLDSDDASIVSGASVTFSGISKALQEGEAFIKDLIGGENV